MTTDNVNIVLLILITIMILILLVYSSSFVDSLASLLVKLLKVT